MNRLFLAAELGIPLIEHLVLTQQQIAEKTSNHEEQLRFVSPENLHLTLRFLGDTPLEVSERIQERLHRFTQGLFPFEVSVKGIGAFPDTQNPRIIWAGFEEKSVELISLIQQSVDKELEHLGISPDPRDYRPHVTLARCRGSIQPLKHTLDALENLELRGAFVRDFVLFESELTLAGPRYTVRDRFPLGPT